MKNSISFCIASAKNEKYYTLGLLKSLEENTNFSKHEVVIFIDSDNQDTYEALIDYKKNKSNIKIHRNTIGFPIGSQRNVSIMFAHATKEVVIYLQSDMVVCPKFDEYFLDALDNNRNRVISAARIEPPLHPPSPEKIVKDFGLSPEEFQYENFYRFTKDLQDENRPLMEGHFAPFGCFKKTYFNIMGGFDTRFRCSREDSDFIIRLDANNIETYQSWKACVYHYTCVSSRGKDWYKNNDKEVTIKNKWQEVADHEELKRFIRKWGYFGHKYQPRYNTTLVLDINAVPHLELLTQIEPYFNKIVLNDKHLLKQLVNRINFNYYYYSNKRWNYDNDKWEELKHGFMASDIIENKFIYTPDYDNLDDVIIESDMSSLLENFNLSETKQFINQQHQIFNNLLTKSPQSYKGNYEIGGFKITINNLVDLNKNHLDNTQYLFDTSKYTFE